MLMIGIFGGGIWVFSHYFLWFSILSSYHQYMLFKKKKQKNEDKKKKNRN